MKSSHGVGCTGEVCTMSQWERALHNTKEASKIWRVEVPKPKTPRGIVAVTQGPLAFPILFIIVIILYGRHNIIKAIFLLQVWGTKKIIFIKTNFPKLRILHSISNNGIQRNHTNNIATSMIIMQIKFHRFFNFLFKSIMTKFKINYIKLSNFLVVFH